MEKQPIKAIDNIDVNPRCLCALPSNIDELIYIFKKQDQIGSDIKAVIEKYRNNSNDNLV